MMRKILSLFAVCWLLFGINGCGKEVEKKEEIEKISQVKVITVQRGNIKEIISLTGDIHGQKEVKVYTKVPGKLGKKIKGVGEKVQKDEVIALIDRDEEAFDFAQAQIKSPIDGIVTIYFADLGEEVYPSQNMPRDPVAIIADMDKVNVIVYVGESEIGKVKKGQSALIDVYAYKDKVCEGIVTKVSPAADTMTRKLEVEISVENPGHLLKPGTFARVDIITAVYKDVIIVPKKAVLEREEEKVVFIADNNEAKMVRVLTGIEDEKNIEIKKGLTLGEKVIIEENYGLIEGTKIVIKGANE